MLVFRANVNWLIKHLILREELVYQTTLCKHILRERSNYTHNSRQKPLHSVILEKNITSEKFRQNAP